MKRMIVCAVLSLLCLTPSVSTPMSARVRSVPKDIQERIFTNPKETLPLLVKNLAGNSQNAADKVKVLHDWICDNIAYDTDIFSRPVGEQDYESVLKKKKAVCAGYTNLMSAMCSLTDVEAIGISGYSKGFGYRGFIEDGQQPDHAWNAVKLGGSWQLVDVTWDAGFVDYRTFIKRYSTNWLHLTPAQFVCSHLPEDNSFQYLKEPKTREEFVREPYIPGTFFALGLATGKNVPDYTNEISASVRYDFRLTKPGLSVIGDVASADGGAIIENASWTDRTGAAVSIAFDVPDKKPYKARVLAGRKSDAAPVFFSIQEFEGELLPLAQQLLLQKKITQAEFDFFVQSYFKVEENGRYYHAENLFAAAQNAATAKILRLTERNTGGYDEVLSFSVQAADGYAGFGSGTLRFPTAYAAYHSAQNTHLVSPESGTLKAGGTYTFAVRTSEFSAAGIVLDGNLVPFKKNPASGAFELEFTVPDNCGSIPVFASKNGTNFTALYVYTVE